MSYEVREDKYERHDFTFRCEERCACGARAGKMSVFSFEGRHFILYLCPSCHEGYDITFAVHSKTRCFVKYTLKR